MAGEWDGVPKAGADLAPIPRMGVAVLEWAVGRKVVAADLMAARAVLEWVGVKVRAAGRELRDVETFVSLGKIFDRKSDGRQSLFRFSYENDDASFDGDGVNAYFRTKVRFDFLGEA